MATRRVVMSARLWRAVAAGEGVRPAGPPPWPFGPVPEQPGPHPAPVLVNSGWRSDPAHPRRDGAPAPPSSPPPSSTSAPPPWPRWALETGRGATAGASVLWSSHPRLPAALALLEPCRARGRGSCRASPSCPRAAELGATWSATPVPSSLSIDSDGRRAVGSRQGRGDRRPPCPPSSDDLWRRRGGGGATMLDAAAPG